MNLLAQETSPYLLQHKDNPVHWHAWNDKAWQRAQAEQKLVLVSIGYSACHWCHVMEHEVFEDFECAEFMNMHFVCIKVDREERPDVDSWYMDAVHLMGSQGGWPLNVFTLPDGRPIFGGTYFPKMKWLDVLEKLADAFRQSPAHLHEYADKLADALHQLNSHEPVEREAAYSLEAVDMLVQTWAQYWDTELGGMRRAPKFPMPNNWEFLLQYGHFRRDESALRQVKTTLAKMALGGIYDQLGGGFARYSVDAMWKVPHFEKMLYDNAQLLSVYAQAYRKFKEPLYSEIIDQTIAFIHGEWKAPNGLYYAALDADSEGQEGKYYVWTEAEIEAIAGVDAAWVKDYFSINKEAYWENGNQILLRTQNDIDWLAQAGEEAAYRTQRLPLIKAALLANRSHRIKPGLDDKCIASWNAFLAIAFFECAKCHGKHELVEHGELLLNAIESELVVDGLVRHALTKNVRSQTILLDDQVAYVEALIAAFELTGKEVYLTKATHFMDRTLQGFQSPNGALLQTRLKKTIEVIGHKCEVQDNVIPAANSIACKSLIRLSALTDNAAFKQLAQDMLTAVWPQLDFAGSYSNWLQCALMLLEPSSEVVVCGPEAPSLLHRLLEDYHPMMTFGASTTESELPLFKGRYNMRTAIYVCRNKTCAPPVFRVEDVRL